MVTVPVKIHRRGRKLGQSIKLGLIVTRRSLISWWTGMRHLHVLREMFYILTLVEVLGLQQRHRLSGGSRASKYQLVFVVRIS